MTQYPALIDERSAVAFSPAERKALWDEITAALNKIALENGNEPKVMEKWLKAWQDFRYHTKRKAKEISNGASTKKFSVAEKRLLGLLEAQKLTEENVFVSSIDGSNYQECLIDIPDTSHVKIEIDDDLNDKNNFERVSNFGEHSNTVSRDEREEVIIPNRVS